MVEVSNKYTSGASTNLTIFKQKIDEGLSAEAAAFGKVYKLDGLKSCRNLNK